MKKSKKSLSVPKEMRHTVAQQLSGNDGKPSQPVQNALVKILGVQRPVVLAYLRGLQRRHPQANSYELARLAERDYLRAVTGTGAAGGAASVIPGVGTVASLGISSGLAVTFLEATALYAQTMAELHGIAVADPEAAKTLVMAVMLGEEAAGLLGAVSEQVVVGRSMVGWGAAFSVATGRGGTWKLVGQEVQRRFLRHFAASQAVGAMGRALPFGIGMAVGGVANRVLGRRVVSSTLAAFAALPPLDHAALDAATHASDPSAKELGAAEVVRGEMARNARSAGRAVGGKR